MARNVRLYRTHWFLGPRVNSCQQASSISAFEFSQFVSSSQYQLLQQLGYERTGSIGHVNQPVCPVVAEPLAVFVVNFVIPGENTIRTEHKNLTVDPSWLFFLQTELLKEIHY